MKPAICVAIPMDAESDKPISERSGLFLCQEHGRARFSEGGWYLRGMSVAEQENKCEACIAEQVEPRGVAELEIDHLQQELAHAYRTIAAIVFQLGGTFDLDRSRTIAHTGHLVTERPISHPFTRIKFVQDSPK